MNWFDVDKAGLQRLMERRGKAWILWELWQNAVDEAGITSVNMEVKSVTGARGLASVVVEDDGPQGFQKLSHAWTLFADSYKKGNPLQRGRWNLGEKLVLALCESAKIATTTGTVIFGRSGRTVKKAGLKRGSRFEGAVRMTQREVDEVVAGARTLIVPEGIVVTINGERIEYRAPRKTVKLSLPTEIADAEGYLRRRSRATTLKIYDSKDGEAAMIYEMGVPIQETGDQWHVEVAQKVPLTFERDSVSPAFLRAVRVAVLNAMHQEIKGEEASAAWVREAASDASCAPDAIKAVVAERFGTKATAFDVSELEANKLATAGGYTVVPGGALSAGEWANVKAAGALLPSGQVTPAPKPYSEVGKPLTIIPPERWSEGMQRRIDYAKRLAMKLLGHAIRVDVANDRKWSFSATYGDEVLVLNLGQLGHKWFDLPHDGCEVNRLLIHEFAHDFERDHLSTRFHSAICYLGAQLTRLALDEPELFGRAACDEAPVLALAAKEE